jgi:hypothetical protein
MRSCPQTEEAEMAQNSIALLDAATDVARGLGRWRMGGHGIDAQDKAGRVDASSGSSRSTSTTVRPNRSEEQRR